MKPIYFNKIEFDEIVGIMTTNRILINIPEKEWSFQTIEKKAQMPSAEIIRFEKIRDKTYTYTANVALKKIKNWKTNFEERVIMDNLYEEVVVFSYGEKLNDNQMKNLLPYCNALDFEPYRCRDMSMKDKGFIGYRDEIRLSFRATTNSYIPYLELPMNYYYDEAHIWPSEKLYRYFVRAYLMNNKKLQGYAIPYGAFSLFGG